MGILSWQQPKRRRSKDEHIKLSFDGGPHGAYVPNMSESDNQKWKAKLVGIKGVPRVEIRKSIGSAQVLIVVKLRVEAVYKSGHNNYPIMDEGINVKISCNSAMQMTWNTLAEMNNAIQEAAKWLNVRDIA